MRILGIDPGTVRMGYGLIEVTGDELSLVDYGVLTCSSHALAQRLCMLHSGLEEILRRFKPDEAAIEEPFVARNACLALAVGRAQAVAILAAAQNSIPIYTYTPAQVKQAVADYGGSRKEQVQEMVRIQLGLPQIPQPDDAADALAVAICHLRQRHIAALLEKNR
jgi:crossover junction endodeoxyribonuclease RuvC